MTISGGHHSLPRAGEYHNGDRAFLRKQAAGAHALFGVIDGLGHGPEAEAVALEAVSLLDAVEFEMGLTEIMTKLHSRLNGSRGAAATVCRWDGLELEVCAVGNVELRCLGLRFPLVQSPGILGSNVRKFRVCRAGIPQRTRIIAFSDGISSRAHTESLVELAPDEVCQQIMNKYRRESDDATVLVVDLG